LPIQISDQRHLHAEWGSKKKLIVILTGCSSEVQHSVGAMSCLAANPAFEKHMYLSSKQLLHKPVSKLFGPGTHEMHRITLMQALRDGKEMPSTYMLLYGGPDPTVGRNTQNPSAGKCPDSVLAL
jgi:hypothetical protein